MPCRLPIVRHLCRKITVASRDPAKVKKVCDKTILRPRRYQISTTS
jgi:hypothetical protein